MASPGRLASSLLILLIAVSSAASAEEPPLITDRPDQTESAFTVPRGLYQIEGGWGYGESRDEQTRVTTQSFPQALLRLGLTDSFELRIGIPSLSSERSRSTQLRTTDRGLTDTSAGFKVVLANEAGALPQTAFIGTLIVPSGDDGLSNERADPAFRFAFSNGLSSRLSLGYNVGMRWLTERDAQGRLDTLSYFDWTVVLGISATDRVGVFVEAFGLSPVSARGGSLAAFDSGITYLVNPRLQLDAAASVGLSGDAPDWTLGLGASFRFPHARGDEKAPEAIPGKASKKLDPQSFPRSDRK